MLIRELGPEDRAAWEPLWNGYLEFYRTALPQEVTETTWQRILDPDEPVHALGAFSQDGRLLGIVQYLFHRSTWSTAVLRSITEAMGSQICTVPAPRDAM